MSRSHSSGLVAKAVLALAVVALIGKYVDDTHTASHPTTARPAHTTSAPTAGGSIQAQARSVFGTGYGCAWNIISHESSGDPHATNPGSGAYGLPQALPADKMATAGPDWRDNPATQLRWMKTYVDGRYGGACPAWTWWQAHHWY
jgi:hypothetical protein